MKMKVRGFAEHKLKDPYKFWSKLLDKPPKRARRCIASYTYVSRIDENTLRFSIQYGVEAPDEEFCLLSSNDTWTITVDPEKVLPRHSSRMIALMNVWVRSNKHGYATHENHIRLYEGTSWTSPTLPYEKGVQIFRGKVVDKHKYIDRKRVVDKEAAKSTIDKLKKVYELAPIMIRLLQAHDVKEPTWREAKQLKQELYAQFDPDNVTALDAERVFRIGQTTTRRRSLWQYHPSGSVQVFKETEEKYQRRCVVNGLRKLREHVYSKEGVYQYKPVKGN